MNKKYILAYGFRRLSACKKLGYKTINAIMHPEKIIKDIPINDIEAVDNTRLHDDSQEFENLMTSIKDNGLLQPVGVWDTDKLTKEDFLTINLIENVHRKDITPYELSQAVNALAALGLNHGQIAVRISQPKTRIKHLMDISRTALKDGLKQSAFLGDDRTNKSGKLPFAVVSLISSVRTTVEEKKSLFDYAKEKSLTTAQISLIIRFLKAGNSVAKSMKMLDKFMCPSVFLVLDKNKVKKYQEKTGQKSLRGIIQGMLQGKIPLEPEMFEY